MSFRTAWRQAIDAAAVSAMADTAGLPAPTNEAQARELAPLRDNPEAMADAPHVPRLRGQ